MHCACSMFLSAQTKQMDAGVGASHQRSKKVAKRRERKSTNAADVNCMGLCTGKSATSLRSRSSFATSVAAKHSMKYPAQPVPETASARKARKASQARESRRLRFSEPVPQLVRAEGGFGDADGTGDVGTAVYRRGRLLGKGGFARCFQIELLSIKEEEEGSTVGSGAMFAVKVVQKSFLDIRKSYWQRWRDEVALTTSCAHPHLVQAFDTFEDSKFCYMRMALYRTDTLNELLRRRRTLTEYEMSYFMVHMMRGLGAFHAMGFVHRDLKLGNMFLDHRMQLRIGDYGLSKKLAHGKRTYTLCGTPNYLAPEILKKCGYEHSIDVWAIGCVGFALLFGQPPFQASDLSKTYAAIRACRPVYPHTWSYSAFNCLNACLQKDPAKRITPDDALRKCRFLQIETVPELPLTVFHTPIGLTRAAEKTTEKATTEKARSTHSRLHLSLTASSGQEKHVI